MVLLPRIFDFASSGVAASSSRAALPSPVRNACLSRVSFSSTGAIATFSGAIEYETLRTANVTWFIFGAGCCRGSLHVRYQLQSSAFRENEMKLHLSHARQRR